VEEAKLHEAADEIRNARRVVFLHCPDRTQDLAPGDQTVLANFIILLRSIGVEADLILPSIAANRAGLELAGADPSFEAGRKPVGDGLPGARTNGELRQLLAEGRIKGALIIGEDAIREDRTASYFRNVEFLAAMDWARTETTMLADIALPGSTYLETDGTRCNFEGRLVTFRQAMKPPASIPGWQVLAQLAGFFNLAGLGDSAEAFTRRLEALVRRTLDGRLPFYWNTGESRKWDGRGTLRVADVKTKPVPVQPALTPTDHYKREILEVGIERYRVR
jgi:anaerobic selenocysteine-containing dehydrogenase